MELETNDRRQVVGVVIYTLAERQKLSYLKEVLYGLEEEEIPFWVEKEMFPTEDIVWAAYRAAIRSVFGVGLCCAHNGIVIHHRNLRKQKPLYYISRQQCTRKKARLLGANAARLIKGIPFAEI
jgi:hypothetical protein